MAIDKPFKIGNLAYTLARQLLVKDKGGIASLPSQEQILGKVQDIFQMLKAGGFNPVSAEKSIKNVNDLKKVLTDIEMKQQVEFNLAKNRSEGLETVLEKMDKGIPLNPGDQAKVEGVEKLADDKVLDAFKGFTPKVIEGGKGKKGIEKLIKDGDVTIGTAPKTKTKDYKKIVELEEENMLADEERAKDFIDFSNRIKTMSPTDRVAERLKDLKNVNLSELSGIEAQKIASELIGRKGPFKTISNKGAKEVLGELEGIIKKADAEPDLGTKLKNFDGDPDAMAQGGRIGFSEGTRREFDPSNFIEQMTQDMIKKSPDGIVMDGKRDTSILDRLRDGGAGTLDPSFPPVEYDDGTVYFPKTDEYYKKDGTQVDGISPGAKPVPKTLEAASGGRIGFNGGGDAGFAGNQMEHGDSTGSFGPGPTFQQPMINTMPQPQLNPMMFNMPMMQRPMPQGIIGLKDGGPPNPGRRNFMKLMAGLASLPVVGKLFKGAKVADKVVQLKNTTTTMPAWFPKFVDRFISKGVGKKVDQDLMQYETKDLPGVKLEVKTDGKIRVEGQNAYNEPYVIDYEPPGYEVVDYSTGKAVKTKGEFAAADTQYFRTGDPREMDYDVDYNTVEDLDDLLGGNSTKLEGFARGTNKEKYTKGQRAVDEADSRADVYEGPDIDMSDYEDFAKGGLAYMLGE
jgi:hypothetical protein